MDKILLTLTQQWVDGEYSEENSASKYVPKWINVMLYELTSLAMLLKASSSAEKRSFRGARFLPEPCVPMLPLEL